MKVMKTVEWPADKKLLVPEDEFWKDEYNANRPLSSRIEDLIIYELHIASLGFGNANQFGMALPGTFKDAVEMLDTYIVPLGINAIELLPVAEFGGKDGWGYGDSHLFALEFRSGGRDNFKHFVKACHQRGIAVLVDVVYNHFVPDAERSQWFYDSVVDEQNIYFWYEGSTGNWSNPDGGYLDNGSTGYAPRLYEENVRNLFISSAVSLATEFHVDGFRVDLTQALHRDNWTHGDSKLVPAANAFGSKLLREWTRTLKLVRPNIFLIAEEHVDRELLTRSTDLGGMGFDATWYADFYHNLVGVPADDSWAALVAHAGLGNDAALRVDWFGGSLTWATHKNVVYHISHDEAGNSGSADANPDRHSHRTIVAAVHGAPLIGATRSYAESRCRVAFGLSILAPATPMFLMGEEVGAAKDYRFNDYIANREDLGALRGSVYNDRLTERVNLFELQQGVGAKLFRFYADIINFRHQHASVRSKSVELLCVSNEQRVIAFRRWAGREDLLVVASFANHPFSLGYAIQSQGLVDADWREVFNSDSADYGGQNVGNSGGLVRSVGGVFSPVVPAVGLLVFERA